MESDSRLLKREKKGKDFILNPGSAEADIHCPWDLSSPPHLFFLSLSISLLFFYVLLRILHIRDQHQNMRLCAVEWVELNESEFWSLEGTVSFWVLMRGGGRGQLFRGGSSGDGPSAIWVVPLAAWAVVGEELAWRWRETDLEERRGPHTRI